MKTENISTLKIQKLTKDQFQNGLENNILDDTSIYLTPVEVKDYALKSDLNTKADLIDNKIPEEQIPDIYLPKEMVGSPNGVATLDAEGKVPLSQLPDNIGNGGGNNPITPDPQIQTDYNQNDDTQIDYIKNRPFYTIPPEYNLNFNLPRTKTTISWDGVIQPNHPKVEFSMDGSLMTYYKVNNDFINSQNVLYGYAKYQFLPETLNNFGMEGLKDYQGIFPLSPDTMTNIVFIDNNDLFFGMILISSTTAGEIPIDALGISLTIPEPGTYFLSDLEGNLIGPGYLSDIEGEIFIDLTDPDVLNNPNYIIGEDLFGSGTLFFAEKLVDSFIPAEQFINGTARVNQVSWDPDNFGDGSASMEMIIPENLLSSENMIIGDDGVSYVILMGGSLPMIVSVNSLTETFEGMLSVNGPGTYLCYSNLNKDAQGDEFWIDKIATQETVFQIDSKYIPKQKTFVPDYNEMDPASDSYIANRPYYSSSYYNYYSGDTSDISLRIAPNSDGTVFYQWGYELYNFQNPGIYNKGYMDAIVKSVQWNNLNIENGSNINYSVSTASGQSGQKVLYVYTYNSNYSEIYWDTFGFQTSNYNAIIAYISLEDNITAKVPTSWNSYTYDDTTVTFPKKGVYYLHSIKDPDNQIYLNRLDLYRERKNIQIQTTNKVEAYTDIPISSRGVYEALGYRDSITTSNYPSNDSSSKDLITSYGLYYGLNNINSYINSYSDNYDTSSLRYRGTSLSSYESTPSQNGTIIWQYE